ncbi:MAG: hypothetical protein LCH81_03670 [Bacteroidetes bacterium]|nr:hypothetical protein [Bacteroidota bacterium]
MKYKFLILLLALVASFSSLTAQVPITYSDDQTLTNQDTAILYLGLTDSKSKPANWKYSVHVRADSLTGANAGTVYLQFSNDGTLWWNHSTSITIDGPASSYDEYGWDGILYARRIRVYAITPSGSRTVRLRTAAIFRK